MKTYLALLFSLIAFHCTAKKSDILGSGRIFDAQFLSGTLYLKNEGQFNFKNRTLLGASNKIQLKKNQNILLKKTNRRTFHLLGSNEIFGDAISSNEALLHSTKKRIDIQIIRNVRIPNCDIYTRDDTIC